MDPAISIVIPVYNEAPNVLPLAEEIAAVASRLPSLEVVWVDDGSTDSTPDRIREAAARHPFVRGLRFPLNQGQSAAMLAGIRAARGAVIVTMDGDRQNNPADIPRLLEALGTAEVVCGRRAHRHDSWSRRIASRIGNAVRNWFTHDGVRDTGCSLKAFRRECAQDLPPVRGVHRFMPAYFKLHGRRVVELDVDHRPRAGGVSKYTNLRRLPQTVLDLFGFCWYRRRVLRTPPPEILA
ncbi:MAG: glycosyltransferase family 2 protein [Kiritimatiellae bacterium]|nr:glycosyltransferase family 2 protein [Kiritimatiellia bacterium]